MYMKADEQEDLVFSSDVASEGLGERRWSETTNTVVRTDDGKLYRIQWERGLTENQDNTFEDGEVPEVFISHELKVKTKTLYLTSTEQQERRPTLAQKMAEEADSYSIATGKQLSEPISDELHSLALKLQRLLSELSPMDLAASSGDYRRATEQYLDAIIKLKESDS